jgi:tol-pal system protein YbgF
LKLSSLSSKGRAALCALAVIFGSSTSGIAAQSILPPAELGGVTLTNAPTRIHVAQVNDSAQLIVRIQQLEEQIRSLNGQVEGLTFQLTQMQELVNRLSEEIRLRFEALEGGAGGKTSAATQSGGVTQPQALPQNPDADAANVPDTVIPQQGVQPLPGEVEFDPTFDDGTGEFGDTLGNSADPLVGTGAAGGLDLVTGQPLNLSYDPAAKPTDNADADAQYKAGYDALMSGDYPFAEDQFSQFLELYPDNPRFADAANLLGDALLYRAAYDQAAEMLLNAFQKDPDNARAPDLLFKLGLSLAGAGERETACRTFEEVSKRYPSIDAQFQTRLSEEKFRAQCPPA